MSETLREAVERLAEEWDGYPGGAPSLTRAVDGLRAALAEHPATPAEAAGEVAEGEREALEHAIVTYEAAFDSLEDTSTEGYARAVLPVVAALTAKARAEAWWEAADAIEQFEPFPGEEADWLRARANREQP